MLSLLAILQILPLCLALPSRTQSASSSQHPITVHCHSGVPWINPGSSAAISALRPGDCNDAIKQFRAFSNSPFGDTNFTSSATITDGTDGTPQISDPNLHLPQVFLPKAWTNGSCQVRLALRNTYTESFIAAGEIFNNPIPANVRGGYDLDSFVKLAGLVQHTYDMCVNGKEQAGWVSAGQESGLALMIIGSQANIGNVASMEGGGGIGGDRR